MTTIPSIDELGDLQQRLDAIASMDVDAVDDVPPEWTMAALKLSDAMDRAQTALIIFIANRAVRARAENAQPPATPVKKKRAREEPVEPRGASVKKKLRYCEGCHQGDMGASSQRDHACMGLHLHPDPAMRGLSRVSKEERARFDEDTPLSKK